MKLKDYAEIINRLTEKNPEADVVYATDNEGSYFLPIKFTPTLGHLYKDKFIPAEEDDKTASAICIN